jgi:hypothetical protein
MPRLRWSGSLGLPVTLEIFQNHCFKIVALPPRPIREHFVGHVLDDGVENDAIAALAGEWLIGMQFYQHVFVRVIAVKAD